MGGALDTCGEPSALIARRIYSVTNSGTSIKNKQRGASLFAVSGLGC